MEELPDEDRKEIEKQLQENFRRVTMPIPKAYKNDYKRMMRRQEKADARRRKAEDTFDDRNCRGKVIQIARRQANKLSDVNFNEIIAEDGFREAIVSLYEEALREGVEHPEPKNWSH